MVGRGEAGGRWTLGFDTDDSGLGWDVDADGRSFVAIVLRRFSFDGTASDLDPLRFLTDSATSSSLSSDEDDALADLGGGRGDASRLSFFSGGRFDPVDESRLV